MHLGKYFEGPLIVIWNFFKAGVFQNISNSTILKNYFRNYYFWQSDVVHLKLFNLTNHVENCMTELCFTLKKSSIRFPIWSFRLKLHKYPLILIIWYFSYSQNPFSHQTYYFICITLAFIIPLLKIVDINNCFSLPNFSAVCKKENNKFNNILSRDQIKLSIND